MMEKNRKLLLSEALNKFEIKNILHAYRQLCYAKFETL